MIVRPTVVVAVGANADAVERRRRRVKRIMFGLPIVCLRIAT